MLSQCVQATEGLSLDSEEQAWMLEQSVTWRSKSMCKRYWLRRWKRGDYVQHLCGLMLKPSHHQFFEEKYVESLGDIHVSHLAQPEKDKERTTQDTCGYTSEGTSGQLDLFGVSSRMFSDIPRWGYGESCPIWKQKVTDAYGEYSQRKKLAHPTKEKESLSWATPRAGNPGSRKPGTGGKVLSEQARNWRTPSVAEVKNQCNSTQIYLQNQVGATEKKGKNWGTPQASDHVEGARTRVDSGQKCLGRDLNRLNSHQDQMKSNMNGKHQEQLNPDWVEQLMGLPIGWTDLGSWGTESAHRQQN